MSPSPDIETLLRQKQMMDQFNQITSQGTGAAMMGGGANLRQFSDAGGGGQGVAYTGLPAPRQGGGGLFSSMVPGLRQVEEAKQGMDTAIQNKINPVPQDPNIHNPAAASDPNLRPQLIRPPAQQLQLGPNGQLTLGGQPQFSQARYTPGMLGQ